MISCPSVSSSLAVQAPSMCGWAVIIFSRGEDVHSFGECCHPELRPSNSNDLAITSFRMLYENLINPYLIA